MDNPSDAKPDNRNGMGVTVSTHVKEDEEIDDDKKTVFDWCQEGNTSQVQKLLNTGDVHVDSKDSEVSFRGFEPHRSTGSTQEDPSLFN